MCRAMNFLLLELSRNTMPDWEILGKRGEPGGVGWTNCWFFVEKMGTALREKHKKIILFVDIGVGLGEGY